MASLNPTAVDLQPTVTAQLTVKDASKAIAMYTQVFGATECYRLEGGAGGLILHAQLTLGSSRIFVRDLFPHEGSVAEGLSRVTIMVDAEDVDATYQRAVAAGAKTLMEPENMFWGDRYSEVLDPFGHRWGIFKRIEELTPEQIQERAAAAFAQ